jgi:FSR family fosmidomycin resistance protein-like MFS transporter
MPWLPGIGLILAGGGIALTGVFSSYAAIFAAALVSGIGVAVFHPEAARFANLASGPKKASGMRWFSVGGNVGFASGPLIATGAVAAFGLPGTLVVALPVTVMAILLTLDVPRFRTFLTAAARTAGSARLPDDWSAFGRLCGYVVIRSTAYIGLVSFIPLYFVHVVGVDAKVADIALTVALLAGIPGALYGGPAADRWGRRPILLCSSGAGIVLLPLLVALTGHGGGTAIGFAIVMLLGFLLTASQPAQIVLGQEYLPNRMGVAAGVTLGIGISLGGTFAPVLGAIADRWGLSWSMLTIALLCAISSAFGLTLPDPNRRRAILAARQAAA